VEKRPFFIRHKVFFCLKRLLRLNFVASRDCIWGKKQKFVKDGFSRDLREDALLQSFFKLCFSVFLMGKIKRFFLEK
jgi:hypothetical protein